jgi:hypothetical protein
MCAAGESGRISPMTRFSQVHAASHPLPFGTIAFILFIPNGSGFHLPVSRFTRVRAAGERARAETYP